jgi:hypothetical protein
MLRMSSRLPYAGVLLFVLADDLAGRFLARYKVHCMFPHPISLNWSELSEGRGIGIGECNLLHPCVKILGELLLDCSEAHPTG